MKYLNLPSFKICLITLLLFVNTFLFCDELQHDDFVIHATPKCGTHLIQKLLHLMMGKYGVQYGGTARGDFTSLNNKLIKSKNRKSYVRLWCPFTENIKEFLSRKKLKVVVITRDPRDALVSMVFHMRQNAGASCVRDFFVVDENFDSLSLDEQISSLLKPKMKGKRYFEFFSRRRGWSMQSEYLTVRYEDLVGHGGWGSDAVQLEKIVEIADFLGIDLSSERIMEIQQSLYKEQGGPITVDGKTFVRSKIGCWKDILSDEHISHINKHYNYLLYDLGYD